MTKYNGPIEEVEIVERVTLTKEQAEAIEQVKDKDYAINILALQKRSDHPLATLEISLIAKLLYGLIKYEIEPEQPKFQPGDKVTYKEKIGPFEEVVMTIAERILERDRGDKKGWKYEDGEWDYEHNLRLATPEEIYWLETLGREKISDFRKDDVFVGHDGSFFILNEIDGEDARIWYKDGALKGLYPAESFKPFPKEESE